MYDLRNTEEKEQDGPSTERPEFPELPELPSHRKYRDDLDESHAGRWVVIFLVAIAIGALGWYGYPYFKQVPAMLAQFPALQKSFDGMNARLTGTETQIKNWAGGQQELRAHVAEIENSLGSRIQAARKQAQALSEKVYQRVEGEMAAQTQATDAKFARLESQDAANYAKLQTEVATLREETARQAEQLRNTRADMERDGANRDQQLVSLNQEMGREAHDVDSINNKLAVKRVDFEVTRNHSQQLSDEISLGITGTDVTHRRVTGWMWIMPDRRTIWLHGQGAQEPVVYYGYKDGKRREVVFTNVAKNSVSGYVLFPAETGATASLGKGD
jgi:hypothetical protein